MCVNVMTTDTDKRCKITWLCTANTEGKEFEEFTQAHETSSHHVLIRQTELITVYAASPKVKKDVEEWNIISECNIGNHPSSKNKQNTGV